MTAMLFSLGYEGTGKNILVTYFILFSVGQDHMIVHVAH